jgi:hypothetical protein
MALLVGVNVKQTTTTPPPGAPNDLAPWVPFFVREVTLGAS